MDSTLVSQAWKKAFPGAAPAGFLCRSAAAERWLRIHSLPDSKRYPDSEGEKAEVLRRYNIAATEVLGDRAACLLFITRFGASRAWTRPTEGPLKGVQLVHVMTEGEGEDEIQIFAKEAIWQQGSFDTLLSAVAEDQTGPILFFNPKRGTAFAPYDGGADLFLETAAAVKGAMQRHQHWLSARPDRL